MKTSALKSLFFLLLAPILIFSAGIGGGMLIFGKNEAKPVLTPPPPVKQIPTKTPVSTPKPTIVASPTPIVRVTGRSVNRQLKVSDKIVKYSVPQNWTSENTSQTATCPGLIIQNPEKDVNITITPICELTWAKTYSSWPANALVIKDLLARRSGLLDNIYRVRITESISKYSYADTEDDSVNSTIDPLKVKILNVILISSSYSESYLPAKVSMNTSNLTPTDLVEMLRVSDFILGSFKL